MDASVPYAREAMPLLITEGAKQEYPCDAETAAAMADACFARAMSMQAAAKDGGLSKDVPVFGVSCTAALVSNRWRRGEHRAHISVRGANSRSSYTIVMEKGTEQAPFRTRVEEDQLTSELLLYAMLKAEMPDAEFKFRAALADSEQLLHEVVGVE